MPAPRLKIDMDKVKILIEKGYNNKEISEKLNITTQTLRKNLKENNLKIKDKEDTMIGQVFGKLKVLERKENAKDRRRTYLCKCECGNTTTVLAKYLNCGDTRSCGCYKDFSSYQEKNYKEAQKRIGEKHGMLTIIDVKRDHRKNRYLMVCKCECGKISDKFYSGIKSGETISCGCYAKEQSSKTIMKVLEDNLKRKKKWYFIKDDTEIMCRSGYEVIYANYLIVNEIKFEYEPKTFKLKNGSRYTPDFYLIDEDKYIEIKGVPYEVLDRGNQKERFDIFSKNHDIDILLWHNLYEICDLPFRNYSYYKVKAKKLNMTVEDYLANRLYLSDRG